MSLLEFFSAIDPTLTYMLGVAGFGILTAFLWVTHYVIKSESDGTEEE